jgi:beta-glucosidase
VVMSDWWAARSTEPAAQGGLDLVMPGPDRPWGTALAAAVNDGRVPEAALDDKVRRILRLAARVGALEGVPPDAPSRASRRRNRLRRCCGTRPRRRWC